MSTTLHIHRKAGKWHGAALRAFLDSQPDGQYAVTIKRTRGRKTTPQCAYLHVLFEVAAEFLNKEQFGTGEKWDKESVKDHCKAEGCYPMIERVMPGGVVVKVPKPTRLLSKEDASDVIDAVIRYWAEWHIILPEPNEQMEMEIAD